MRGDMRREFAKRGLTGHFLGYASLHTRAFGIFAFWIQPPQEEHKSAQSSSHKICDSHLQNLNNRKNQGLSREENGEERENISRSSFSEAP